jgi:hypothetical protein
MRHEWPSIPTLWRQFAANARGTGPLLITNNSCAFRSGHAESRDGMSPPSGVPWRCGRGQRHMEGARVLDFGDIGLWRCRQHVMMRTPSRGRCSRLHSETLHCPPLGQLHSATNAAATSLNKNFRPRNSPPHCKGLPAVSGAATAAAAVIKARTIR